jgi:CRISPR-associated protein Csd2
MPKETTMNNTAYTDPAKRHDFLLLFDVIDGNPNGDPDAGNMPRIDPETGQGLVTDVCLKRKVRDFVVLTKENQSPNRIYVQNTGVALNSLHEEAYKANEIKSTGTKQKREEVQTARQWMCANFYDVRMFGAVMTTGVNAGQVRGPAQLTFARSIDPIVALDVAITRVAVTKAEDIAFVEGDDGKAGKGGKVTEMGRKALLPYGLYLARGFFSPAFAKQTGVTADDLALFWQALQQMWDLDRSASRGMMACRGLYIFTHENPLGNAPAHQLFDRCRVELREPDKSPRRFTDYKVLVDSSSLPNGVTLSSLVVG